MRAVNLNAGLDSPLQYPPGTDHDALRLLIPTKEAVFDISSMC